MMRTTIIAAVLFLVGCDDGSDIAGPITALPAEAPIISTACDTDAQCAGSPDGSLVCRSFCTGSTKTCTRDCVTDSDCGVTEAGYKNCCLQSATGGPTCVRAFRGECELLTMCAQ